MIISGLSIASPRNLSPDALEAMSTFLGANQLAQDLNITAVVRASGHEETKKAIEEIDEINGQALEADADANTVRKIVVGDSKMFIYPPLPEREEDDWRSPNTAQTRILSGLFTIATRANR